MPTTLHDLANFLQKQADRTHNNPELQAYYQRSADRYRAQARMEGVEERPKPRLNANNGARNSCVYRPSTTPINLHMDKQLRQFIKQSRSMSEMLQIVEDSLAEQGYDDFMVATDRGTWQWMRTVERARKRAAEV